MLVRERFRIRGLLLLQLVQLSLVLLLGKERYQLLGQRFQRLKVCFEYGFTSDSELKFNSKKYLQLEVQKHEEL